MSSNKAVEDVCPLPQLEKAQKTANIAQGGSNADSKMGVEITLDKPSKISIREKLHNFRSNDYFLTLVTGFCVLTEVGLYTLYTPLLAFYLEDLGYRDVESFTGYTTSAYAGGLAIGSIVAGCVGQVVTNKRAILLVNVGVLTAAIILFMFVPNIAGMIVARALQGISAAGLWTASMALLTEFIDPARVGRMIGLAMVGFSAGSAASQPIGGALYQKFGWKAPSYFALGLLGLVAILCAAFAERTPNKTAGPSDVDKSKSTIAKRYNFWHSIKFILTHAKYMTAFAIAAWWGLFNGGVLNTGITLRLADRYHLNAQQVGNTFLATAISSLLGMPVAGWLVDRLGSRKVSLICLCLFTTCTACMCIDSLPYAGFIGFMVGIGFSMSLTNIPVVVYLAKIDREYEDAVGASFCYGAWNMAFSVSALGSPILSGELLQRLGVSLGWKVLLGSIAGCGVATLALVYKYMRLAPAAEVTEVKMENERMV